MAVVSVTVPLDAPVACADCCGCLWSCTSDLMYSPCCQHIGVPLVSRYGRLVVNGVDYGNVCVALTHLGCGLYFADTTTAVLADTGRPVTIPRVTLRYRCKEVVGVPGVPDGWYLETTVGAAAPVEPPVTGDHYQFLQAESLPASGGTGDTAWTWENGLFGTGGAVPGGCCSCDTGCECTEATDGQFETMPPAHSPFATICVAVYNAGVLTGTQALDWGPGSGESPVWAWYSRPCCPEYSVLPADALPGEKPKFTFSTHTTTVTLYSDSVCGALFTDPPSPFGCPDHSNFFVACTGCTTPFQGGAFYVSDGSGGVYCQTITPFAYPAPPAGIYAGPLHQQPDGTSAFDTHDCDNLPSTGPCAGLCTGGDHYPNRVLVWFEGDPWASALYGWDQLNLYDIGGPFGALQGIGPGCVWVAATGVTPYVLFTADFAAGTVTLELVRDDPDNPGGTVVTGTMVYAGDFGDCCTGTAAKYGQYDGDYTVSANGRPTGGTRTLAFVSSSGEVPTGYPATLVLWTSCCYSNGPIPPRVGSACVGADCRPVYSPHTPEYPGLDCAPFNCAVRGWRCVGGVACREGFYYPDPLQPVYGTRAECAAAVCGTPAPTGSSDCYEIDFGDTVPSENCPCNRYYLVCWDGEKWTGGGVSIEEDPDHPGEYLVAWCGATYRLDAGGFAGSGPWDFNEAFRGAESTSGSCAPAPTLHVTPYSGGGGAMMAPRMASPPVATAARTPAKPAARTPLPMRPPCQYEGAVVSYCTTCNGEAKHVRQCYHEANPTETCTRGNPSAACWCCANCEYWEGGG